MKIDYGQNFEEGNYYHIYNHSVSDKNVFNNERDYIDFLFKHKKYLSCVFETLAYCLMPNHFHFIVRVKSSAEILQNANEEKSIASTLFQKGDTDLNTFVLDQHRRFFSSYSLSYNFRHNRRGQLFLKRFKRVSLDPDTGLMYMICYVHHNPIHHGFKSDYTSWKYTSYGDYIPETRDDHHNEIMTNLFDGKKNFLQIHKEFKFDKEKK